MLNIELECNECNALLEVALVYTDELGKIKACPKPCKKCVDNEISCITSDIENLTDKFGDLKMEEVYEVIREYNRGRNTL